MSRNNVNFDDKKTKKIDDIDVNKILGSKEEPYGTENSFIGYNTLLDTMIMILLDHYA